LTNTGDFDRDGRGPAEVFGLEGVSYSYGGASALKDLSFSVALGESIAVLGANGSGKTTLLKILDGLVFPSAGVVRYHGEALTEEGLDGPLSRRFRERVGFVFHEPDVQLFCPTVFDELAFAPLHLGVPEREVEARVSELLGSLGMGHIRDRPPYTLSGGEKKKVAIACVLTTNPDVLLMDEPTNGLDPRTQVWLIELIQGLKALKKTIVISTHDLSLAGDVSDRAIVIDESHGMAADGPADEVLNAKALLLGANIIHEHAHRHGAVVHAHSHGPYSMHDGHDREEGEGKRR
jgi:cobalt/nickel transport system ATP-binding protein